jgi:hypothetical protein
MRRPAKILLAGVMLALPMLPPFSGAATSQSTVGSSGAPFQQNEYNDVTGPATLDVVTPETTAGVAASATGNGLSALVDYGSMAVFSAQTLTANPAVFGAPAPTISATGAANVSADIYGLGTVVTATTGNTVEAGNTAGAGALGDSGVSGTIDQTVGAGVSILSNNDITASLYPTDTVSVGDFTASSQAIANAISLYAVAGAADVTTNQSSSAIVDAESGSLLGGAEIQHTPGTAAFSSIAIDNNLTATGTTGSSQTLDITQTAAGGHVIGGQFLNVGNGQTIQGEAVATGNNVSASNEGSDLNVTNVQTNHTDFTQAMSVVTGYEFGSGQSTAMGVGNSVMAANQGPSTELSSTQTNSSDVTAYAEFSGGNTVGLPTYDAVASSTAIGNAATAFACTDCGGVINISGSQTNSNSVTATTLVNFSGASNAQSVSATATAVGNNATFYVTRPK